MRILFLIVFLAAFSGCAKKPVAAAPAAPAQTVIDVCKLQYKGADVKIQKTLVDFQKAVKCH